MVRAGQDVEAFIDRWSQAEASERANAQLFLTELTDILGVDRPANSHAAGYSFEFPVRIPLGPDTFSEGRIDLYRRGCFVLEAKQFVPPRAEQTDLELVAVAARIREPVKKYGPHRGTDAWDDAMWRAKGQAERYARNLPSEEPPAPFLLVVDVGHSVEVYADFTQAGRAYTPFPGSLNFRIRLADLQDEAIRARLRTIWVDPLSLDPAKISAEVTREIAGYLATLAASLEEAGHPPKVVAEFLTRCLFCMFAEDVGLLEKESFYSLLESLRASPEGFVPKVRQLFSEMQTGIEFSVVLNKKLLRFNGGVFEDASVLPVNGTQLGILILAAAQQWKNVEPAIFGTLLERALDPDERHKLGAHYTPREYVERLVLPTLVEPLRAEWDTVRAAALVYAQKGDLKKARAEVNDFHNRLCAVTVLDPACGSGNFLYVALQHLKMLEGEVLDAAAQFGENFKLELETHTIDPHQFLGLELNPRAASIAELVLWIGYLQWHFKIHGERIPQEPILRAFRNIECRDALLTYDGEPQPVRDGAGEIVTVWDRRSMKTDLVTGRKVPDEAKRIPLLIYPNPRPAEWPMAHYIVGNPPFIGTARMRDDLGDGYTETLRAAYPDVPESADFVMYWWQKAAILTRDGACRGFGLITTNSLRQTLNRKVVQQHLGELSIVFAIPDHPWVDPAGGDEKTAAVRISMTVAMSGQHPGHLYTVSSELPHEDGSSNVTFTIQTGIIQSDLSLGANVVEARQLTANVGIAIKGFELGSQGFLLPNAKAEDLLAANPGFLRVLRPYMNGDDLKEGVSERHVIDFHGLTEGEAREFGALYQHTLTTVKPDKSQNREKRTTANWWLFRRSGDRLRSALSGLTRFIGTTRTAKHRVFQFLPAGLVAESKIVVIASEDAFVLGVLSSRTHVLFATRAGAWLGVGNDPTYNHLDSFNKFPFPACDEAMKARIRALGEELDAHRKRVQAHTPGLSLTAMYNVLEAVRIDRVLGPKEQAIHDAGLVSVLRELHDQLDVAVTTAYGWPKDLPDAEILTRLVDLNAERADEETSGLIRWLRPEYQNPQGTTTQTGLQMAAPKAGKAKLSKAKMSWPRSLAERVRLVEAVLRSLEMPSTAHELAKRFSRANGDDVAEILDTLVTLGRAHRTGERFSR